MAKIVKEPLFPCQKGCTRQFLSLIQRRNHHSKKHSKKRVSTSEQNQDDIEMEEANVVNERNCMYIRT